MSVSLPVVTGFAIGLYIAAISGIINNSHFIAYFDHPTAESLERLAAAPLLSSAVGALLVGSFADRWGRNAATCFAAFLLAAGCAVQASPLCHRHVSLEIIFFGRGIAGLGLGAALAVTPTYISEIALPERRGRLEALFVFAVAAGLFGAYVMNYILLPHSKMGWQWSFALHLPPSLLILIVLGTLPESPRWFAMCGNIEGAQRALFCLRGTASTKQVEDELQAITSSIEAEEAAGWMEALGSVTQRQCTVAILVLVLQNLTGIDVVTVYAPQIFAASTNDRLDETHRLLYTMWTGLAFVLPAPVAVLVVDSWGRRPLLLLGSLGMTFSVAGLAFCQSDRIRMASTIGFVASYSFGFGPVCMVLAPELVQTRLRSKMIALASALAFIVDYFVVATYLSLANLLGETGPFKVYLCINVAALLFCFHYVPETVGCELDSETRATSARPSDSQANKMA